jgi:dTDP-3-amino-3,4,6-trideoxy-alpha-D-glucose transaminase
VILANDFERQWRETRDETLHAVEAVGSAGWYILGKEVAEFEASLAAVWRRKHAIGVASGLDALEISLRALGCRTGDKVLTTPVSAFATTMAIVRLGAIPVFVDCDDYGLIDLGCCEAALRQHRDIRFFLPVHLYGHSLDLSRLKHMRETYDVHIVEDCAQSILAFYGDGQPTGSIGQMAATSFYPTKNLGALGDGGAILTDNDELAQTARILRDYGQSGKYRHTMIGYNSRLDEIQAAILRRVHLPRLEQWTGARREIARAYSEGISHPGIRNSGTPPGSRSCWHLFPLFVAPENKVSLIAHLRARNITVAEHYPEAIVDQPALQAAQIELLDDCSTARRLCRSEVSIPIHPYLARDEITAVIDACNDWKR